MEEEYDLLIEPLIITKNKRILLFFKPKEVIQNSPFELKLKITNKGGRIFSGGILKDFKSFHPNAKIVTNYEDEKIPRIPIHENRIINMGECMAYSSGILSLQCNIVSDDNKKVNYYQKDKLEDDKSNLLKEVNHWEDIIVIFNMYEINQKYTNYLLSIMTLLLLAFTILQVFFIWLTISQ